MKQYALSLILLIPLLGCPTIQGNARDVSAALGGVLTAAQTQNQACKVNPTMPNCILINKGIAAQNALITSAEIYCGWSPVNPPTDPNTKCVPVKSAEAAVTAAIGNANLLITEIKGIIK
jgi:hypothetical protein